MRKSNISTLYTIAKLLRTFLKCKGTEHRIRQGKLASVVEVNAYCPHTMQLFNTGWVGTLHPHGVLLHSSVLVLSILQSHICYVYYIG